MVSEVESGGMVFQKLSEKGDQTKARSMMDMYVCFSIPEMSTTFTTTYVSERRLIVEVLCHLEMNK